MVGSFIDVSPWLGMPPERSRRSSPPEEHYRRDRVPRNEQAKNDTRSYADRQTRRQPKEQAKPTAVPHRTSAAVPMAHVYRPPPPSPPQTAHQPEEKASSPSDSEAVSESESDNQPSNESPGTQTPKTIGLDGPAARSFRYTKKAPSPLLESGRTRITAPIILGNNLMLDPRFPNCFVREKLPKKPRKKSPDKPTMTDSFANMFGFDKIIRVEDSDRPSTPRRKGEASRTVSSKSSVADPTAYPPPPIFRREQAEDGAAISSQSSKAAKPWPTPPLKFFHKVHPPANYPPPPAGSWVVNTDNAFLSPPKASRSSAKDSLKTSTRRSNSDIGKASSKGSSVVKGAKGSQSPSASSSRSTAKSLLSTHLASEARGSPNLDDQPRSSVRSSKASAIYSEQRSSSPATRVESNGDKRERKGKKASRADADAESWSSARENDWADDTSRHSTRRGSTIENSPSSMANSSSSSIGTSSTIRPYPSHHSSRQSSRIDTAEASKSDSRPSSSKASRSSAATALQQSRTGRDRSRNSPDLDRPRIIAYRHVPARHTPSEQPTTSHHSTTTTGTGRSRGHGSHRSVIDGPFESWHTYNPHIWSPQPPPSEIWDPDTPSLAPFDSGSATEYQYRYRGGR